MADILFWLVTIAVLVGGGWAAYRWLKNRRLGSDE